MVVVVVVFAVVSSVVLTVKIAGATGAIAGGVSGSASLIVTTVSFEATPRKGSILEPMLKDRPSSAAKSSVSGTLRSGRVGGALVGEMGLVGELSKSMRLERELQRPEVKRVDSLWIWVSDGLVGDLVAFVSICADPVVIPVSKPVRGMSSFSKPSGFGSTGVSFPLELSAGVMLVIDVRLSRDLPLLKGVLGLLAWLPSWSAVVRDWRLFGESKACSALALLPCTGLTMSIPLRAGGVGTV